MSSLSERTKPRGEEPPRRRHFLTRAVPAARTHTSTSTAGCCTRRRRQLLQQQRLGAGRWRIEDDATPGALLYCSCGDGLHELQRVTAAHQLGELL